MVSPAASPSNSPLASLDPREPSCCPYCSDSPEKHWIKWSSYLRYAPAAPGSPDPPVKIKVPRYRCRFECRTFSLLPDGLLPYQGDSTEAILEHIREVVVEDRPATTYARRSGRARTTIRRLKARVAAIVLQLRLPGQEGALEPRPFFERLLALGEDTIAAIFRAWKELEPKHSIVGFYPR